MPTHVKEVPALLLQADNSELFGWVEEKLEGIGLDGKLYSRVIKSVLRANLDEEEIELNIEHKRVSYHELIDEILLASMWKGSDKTDDYWIFKKVISDFVKKYKSRGMFSDTDVASSNELESPDERYEEAFPSLSNACDEIAWNIPRWTCMSERSRAGDLTSLITGSDDNDDAVHIFHAERDSIWDRRFRSRRRNRRTKPMPTSTRCNDNISRHRLNASGGFKRQSIPCGDMTSSEETFKGEFHPCKTVSQSKGGRWRGRHSESNEALLMSDGDETGSFTSQFSFNKVATTQDELETMKAVPLKLLFPNLNVHNSDNINSHTYINDSINNYCNNTNNLFYSSLNRDKRDEEGHAYSNYRSGGLGETNCGRWSDTDLIVFDLLTLPFMSGQSSPNHVIQELRSLIPDYPWSSPAKNWIPCKQRFDDVQHKGSKRVDDDNDDITDNIINASNDDDDDYGRVMTKNYPQSPLPYFHPDPPSYALFPWNIELNRI